MDNEHRIFTCDGSTYTFHMIPGVGDGYYMSNATGDNDIVFVYILNRSFPDICTIGWNYHSLKHKWASRIIDAELGGGVWPVASTKTDCIKICDYLDMLTKMNQEDCRAYLLNHINDILIEHCLEEF